MNLKQKKYIIPLAVLVFACFSGCSANNDSKTETVKVINASIGSIRSKVTSTGTVQPKNRVEIKPSTNGRVEDILVNEGDSVKKGQVLVWMSSEERASLLDAARSKGAEELKYWQDVYKPTPLIAPIDGEVIVRGIEPGQSVTTATAVLVLSDRLIVGATVDETDIGKIQVGQEALIGLDAYPDVSARGKVDHISYESKTVNNVTTYEVDIMPNKVPPVFRSGMTANVSIYDKQKSNILVLPLEAVSTDNSGNFVSIDTGIPGKTERRKIETGISDLSNVEIKSGITENDKIVISSKKFALGSQSTGTNPFFNPPKARTQTSTSTAKGAAASGTGESKTNTAGSGQGSAK